MLKYLVFITILLILWVTEPMWIGDHVVGGSAPSVPFEETEVLVDAPTLQSHKEDPKEHNTQTQKEKKYIETFGPKPSVDYDSDTPYAVKTYWKSIYKHPERILPLSCTRLKMTPKGWQTTCNFKTQEHGTSRYELQQELYYIKNGSVSSGSGSHVNLN